MGRQLDLFVDFDQINKSPTKPTPTGRSDENATIHRKQTDVPSDNPLERTLPEDVDGDEEGGDGRERGTGSSTKNSVSDGTIDGDGIHRRSGMGNGNDGQNSFAGRSGRGDRTGDGRNVLPIVRDGARVTDFAHGRVGQENDQRLENINLGAGGKKAKFKNNLDAIRTLRDVEARDTVPTREQKNLFALYVGWGGLQEVFRRQNGTCAKGWDHEVELLEATLTESEYKAAKLSTTDAHYTSRDVASAMWKCVTMMGFVGGKVLEPACGIGNFIGLMPTSASYNSTVHAVELDDLTARMVAKLYPQATIHAQGFEQSQLYDPEPNSYDLVITNPPFGNQRVHDDYHKAESKHSIHNYFVLKSLTATRPNGVVAMVISRYFLDSKNRAAREAVAENAEFLGAVRLPNTAFLQNAGTAVTSDIVFFRKYSENEGKDVRQSPTARRWLDVVYVDDANPDSTDLISVNAYYADNPEMMLGQWGSFGSTIHGTQGALIPHEGKDTTTLLNAALATLPTGFMPEPEKVIFSEQQIAGVGEVGIGSMFVCEGRIYLRENNNDGERRASPVALKPRDYDRTMAFIALRTALSKLVNAELGVTAQSDSEIELLRRLTNQKYDDFARRFGHLQSRPNKALFRTDPAWSKIAALEAHDASPKHGYGRPSVTKAAILKERTLYPNQTPTKVENASDALASTLAIKGKIDLAFMESIYAKEGKEIIDELGAKVFEVERNCYETAESFLSGDVKAKLKLMRRYALDDYRYGRNVTALESVIPPDVPISKINIKVGAHWLPDDVMTEFVRELLGDEYATALYSEPLGTWGIKSQPTYENNIRWGTRRVSAKKTLLCAIEQKSASVFDRDDDGNRILNHPATAAANAKAEWVMSETPRRALLGKLYNERFNTHADCVYDGSHLTFPGKVGDSQVKLQKHQSDAVWRILSASSPVLLHHVVGAGKTYTMITAAMEMRRLGTASKPMFVIPNSLVGQWASEFNRLYPAAQILVPEKKDFTKENRELLFARIAHGNWDAVLVAHSSFDRIHASVEVEIEFIETKINELLESKSALDAMDDKTPSIKDIARRIKTLEAQLHKLISSPRDNGYKFNELGVDALFIDESQEYKNLAYATSINRVAGISNVNGSKKALQLFIKSRSLLATTGGKNLVFASGTPISNSIPEMFTLQCYLDYDRVKAMGLAHFDAWARMFGEITYDYELTATQTYRQVSRFSKFGNLPELITGYKVFSDIVTRENIERNRSGLGLPPQIPPLIGDQPTAVIANRSDDQADAIENLVLRADDLRLPDNMLAVMTDARKIALDMRIIDSNWPDFAGSKINIAATNITRIYNETEYAKGVQLVFLDLSTPKGGVSLGIKQLYIAAEEGDDKAQLELDKFTQDEVQSAIADSDFSVYDDLKLKLLSNGIPQNDIAFIHDANTDVQKKTLFNQVDRGDIRILLGSTSRMGAGVNVQSQLVALHHLDCPWRPSDVEQREGRILRPGNALYAADPDNFKVQIFRYATKQTLDSRMWQTIECKATFIQQILDLAETGEREMDDGVNEAQMAAIMKAESSGDPRLLEDIELSATIKKLQLESQAFDQETYEIEHQLKNAQRILDTTPATIDTMKNDLLRGQNAPIGDKFSITLDGQTITNRKSAGTFLIKTHRQRISEYAENRSHYVRQQNDDAVIGKYAGFPISIESTRIFNDVESHQIILHGESLRYSATSAVTVDSSPSGLMASVHAAITKSLSNRIEFKQKELTVAQIAYDNLDNQKTSRGVEWRGGEQLAKLKEASANLKKAMAKDGEKAKQKLREKKQDAANKNAIEMVD